MERNRIPFALTAGFLAMEGGLYAGFLMLDGLGRTEFSIALKYAGILLCLTFALLSAARGGDWLIPTDLAFTAGADWFLLVRNDCYAVGVALFVCVQTVYYLRLRRLGAKNGSWLRSGLALCAGAGLYLLKLAQPLNLLAGLYFSQLLSNTIIAWTLRGKRNRLFAVGLTLFVGCDVCVGLFHVLPPDVPAYHGVAVGMWAFYLPSQVLIALSARPEQEEVP